MRKVLSVMLIVGVVSFLLACSVQAQTTTTATLTTATPTVATPTTKYVFATVVKSVAFNWFKRMDEGIQKFAKDYHVKAFMTGPSEADSAKQIAYIENLIAQHVNAIINDPYGVVQQEAVQKEAMDAGIIVIGQEEATGKYFNYDVEAFDDQAYGEEMMKQLAKFMNYQGEYIQFVGSLTNSSHMTWMSAARAYQEKHYPNMKFIGLYESKETETIPYDIVKSVLVSHPHLKGIMGSAALDIVGAARAVVQAGLTGKIAIVGTSIPSYCGDLLKIGAINMAMAWDPAVTGYVANLVAYDILTGKQITDGMDLGVPGFEHIKIVKNEYGFPVIYGSGWIEITASNEDQYPF